MNTTKILNFAPFIIIAILVALNLHLFNLLKIERQNNFIISGTKNSESKQESSISDTPLADRFLPGKCEYTSNVGMAECVIELLDRAAAEREWKQKKIETAKHPQINKWDLMADLSGEQLKIRKWREGFEKARDEWCNAKMSFIMGSGTPLSIASCQLEIELKAIKDLNELYKIIMESVGDSQGIVDFGPTKADLDTLIKVNATSRGCVWAGETDCE